MSKKLLIDARLADETRIVVLNNDAIEDVDYESTYRKPIKGNIYLTKVTRVEPSLQACFVEYGGNRQGFLAFNEIHPDYYRIPVEDHQRLLEEEKQNALAAAEAEAAADADADTSNASGEAGADFAGANGNALAEAPSDAAGDGLSDGGRMRHRFARFRNQYSIQEVISRNQIMLVQVVKEERGSKGAAMSTYLSLAGRYCVLMPNTFHSGGISRKISDGKDRKKLKSIISGFDIPLGMAVIARTAGSGRTKTEVTRDYNQLLKQWEEIRSLTMKSSAPMLIYEGADLIKRAVRDYYSPDVGQIIVEGAEGYKAARLHMKNLMPTHVKKVKQHKGTAAHLFQHYNVESMLAAMHEPRVELKSGGSLVINQTEALVAIDVNSGKATRERSIEETALKTNLEAANEIARQLKQRDLSGLIVIDFIDMESGRNKRAVENALRDALRADKARAQIGNISQFGLLEMSRQRLRPSLSEATSEICPRCHGTGRVRPKEIEALSLLNRIEDEISQRPAAPMLVSIASDMALHILNHKRAVIDDFEARYGVSITLQQDATLLASQIRFGDEEPTPAATANGVEEANGRRRQRPRGKRGGSKTRTATMGEAAAADETQATSSDAETASNSDASRPRSRTTRTPRARSGGRRRIGTPRSHLGTRSTRGNRRARPSRPPSQPDLPASEMPAPTAGLAAAASSSEPAPTAKSEEGLRATTRSAEFDVVEVGSGTGGDKKSGYWSRDN